MNLYANIFLNREVRSIYNITSREERRVERPLWQWTILVVILVLNAIPISKILGRVGLNKWWTIAFLFPFVNIVALWIFAHARWPALDRAAR